MSIYAAGIYEEGIYAEGEAEDTTPPTLTSPAGAALGAFGAAGSVSTDEANGTLYWVTTINASESAATVKAGNSQAVAATGLQNVTSSGLTPETTYRNHFLHRDAAGNDSTVSSSGTFTTPADTGPAPSSNRGDGTMRSCMRPTMRKAFS